MTKKLIVEEAYTPYLEQVICALIKRFVSSEQLTNVTTPPHLWSPTGNVLMSI
jgi:hypothetical protein